MDTPALKALLKTLGDRADIINLHYREGLIEKVDARVALLGEALESLLTILTTGDTSQDNGLTRPRE